MFRKGELVCTELDGKSAFTANMQSTSSLCLSLGDALERVRSPGPRRPPADPSGIITSRLSAIVVAVATDAKLLSDLRLALLQERPPGFRPDQGLEAFRAHRALATEIHRAARLDRYGEESETRSWVRYVTTYFPPGRNGSSDAELLFKKWRTPLLKDGAPGPEVVVTHGQPHTHWTRDSEGRLWIDLESMWDDFDSSVGRFIGHLQSDPDRLAVAAERWRKNTWTVQAFRPISAATVPVSGATGSATPGPDS